MRFLKYLLFSILLSSSFSVFSQSIKSELKNPGSTVIAHLKYLNKEDYNEFKASETLMPNTMSQNERVKIAKMLLDIYDGKGYFIDTMELPKDPNYIDSTLRLNQYIVYSKYPQLYVEKKGQYWFYSEESIDAIPKIYKEVYPFGDDLLPKLFKSAGGKKIFNIYLWQFFGIMLILGTTIIFYFVFSWLFGYLIFKLVKRFFGQEIAKKFILPVARPLSLLLMVLLFWTIWPILKFDVEINNKVRLAVNLVNSIFGMVIFYRLVDIFGAYLDKAAKRTESTLDDQLVPMVNKSLKVFVIIVGVLFILQNFGYNITALIGGLAIGGLAFALAAQDTIKNLFGSLMIFLDKPFQIGDWIVTDKVDGTVEEVGFRSTKVRTFKNSLITVPNGKLADQAVDNMGARIYRRFDTQIAITYDTPPLLIEAFISGIREIIKVHPHTRKDYFIVELNQLATYSLNIMLYMFFKAENWNLELKYRNDIILAILKLADKLGVRFAFPTETLFVEEVPGQKSLTPKYSENKEEYRNKIIGFINELKRSKAYAPPPREQVKQPIIDKKENTQNQSSKSNLKAELKSKFKKSKQKRTIPEVEKPVVEKPKQPNIVFKKGKELTPEEIKDIAKEFKIEHEALKALIDVESKGRGFYQSGKPEIAFEGHRFWKELIKKDINPEEFNAKYPEVVYERWTKRFYKGNEKEYDRLDKAKEINKDAAYMATKWGLFKLPGYAFKECGYASINEFVYNHYQTEREQLIAFINYIISKNLLPIVQEHNWEEFAKKYNGPNYKKANYHQKLEDSYNKLKT